ncbi:hypothetical protein LshimejAT787_2001130 [Lyophyllum shimeji]|uniref:Uncharacterized protein n=1 Tax=Lyophyllum shimeji TaxID=47721 RepID=A0A9P3Q070_LYOSH|nr:hypothetical protein LshimejAT787_2001130 [Lyophyllum shimeji]
MPTDALDNLLPCVHLQSTVEIVPYLSGEFRHLLWFYRSSEAFPAPAQLLKSWDSFDPPPYFGLVKTLIFKSSTSTTHHLFSARDSSSFTLPHPGFSVPQLLKTPTGAQASRRPLTPRLLDRRSLEPPSLQTGAPSSRRPFGQALPEPPSLRTGAPEPPSPRTGAP